MQTNKTNVSADKAGCRIVADCYSFSQPVAKPIVPAVLIRFGKSNFVLSKKFFYLVLMNA